MIRVIGNTRGVFESMSKTANARPMIFDLHNHTSRYSRGCSILDPRELVKEAEAAGLDGTAIVEHNHQWSAGELDRLREFTREYDLALLRGRKTDVQFQHISIFNHSGPFFVREHASRVIARRAPKEALRHCDPRSPVLACGPLSVETKRAYREFLLV